MNGKPQTVVVTGASAGVGRAVARAFAARGARIGLVARGTDGLRGAATEVEAEGGHALILPTDVADPDALEAAAAAVEDSFGSIDVWVNVAMATIFAPVDRITPEEFRRATEVTYLGSVYGIMAALKRMRPRNRGTIVQVGSALAYRAIPLQSAYCGGKFAIRGFVQSLRCELLHDKSDIHLAIVQMPALNTPQFDWARNRMPQRPQPVAPIFQPEVAARAVLFAVDSRRREVWVGRSTVMAILGNRLAPGLLDHYLGRTGYSGQLTDEPADPNAPDNLMAPVAGDHGAHGRFDAQASAISPQLWATRHRTALLSAFSIAAAVTGMACLNGRWRFRQKNIAADF
jgi:NAD(P)-dependent dehydrogenase (short-subunit alcohol dehydrogenase family)